MTDRQELLQLVMAANPYPASEDLPGDAVAPRPSAASVISDLPTVDHRDRVIEDRAGGLRWRGPLAALAAGAAVVLVVVAGSLLFGGAEAPPPAGTVTTVPSTTVPPTTTTFVGAAISDPWGLSEVRHPANQGEANAVFLGMPDHIDGMDASHDDPSHVGFIDYEGGGNRVSIGWFEAGPDAASTIEFLAGIEGLEEFTTTAGDLTTEQDFIWLHGTVDDPAGSIHLAWWGQASSGWLFSVEAGSEAHRDAVIGAYVESAARMADDLRTGSLYDFAVAGPHEQGPWVPKSGFVVTESPFDLTIIFMGRLVPDVVEIDGIVVARDGAYADWGVTVPVSLDPGPNEIPVVVLSALGSREHLVRILYEPEGQARLGSIVAADDSSITVDWVRWDDDQEFPGPVDDDPGVIEALAVDPTVSVIIDADTDTDYRWLLEAVGAWELIEQPYWYPEDPYWITTAADGAVIEIVKVPLG